jgi:hypothetical protein
MNTAPLTAMAAQSTPAIQRAQLGGKLGSKPEDKLVGNGVFKGILAGMKKCSRTDE